MYTHYDYSLYNTPDDRGFLLARKERERILVFVARTDTLWDISKSNSKEDSNAKRKR